MFPTAVIPWRLSRRYNTAKSQFTLTVQLDDLAYFGCLLFFFEFDSKSLPIYMHPLLDPSDNVLCRLSDILVLSLVCQHSPYCTILSSSFRWYFGLAIAHSALFYTSIFKLRCFITAHTALLQPSFTTVTDASQHHGISCVADRTLFKEHTL